MHDNRHQAAGDPPIQGHLKSCGRSMVILFSWRCVILGVLLKNSDLLVGHSALKSASLPFRADIVPRYF